MKLVERISRLHWSVYLILSGASFVLFGVYADAVARDPDYFNFARFFLAMFVMFWVPAIISSEHRRVQKEKRKRAAPVVIRQAWPK